MREHPTVSHYSQHFLLLMALILIWILSLASIVLMLVRPRGLPEWVWIGGGAVLLVVTGLLPLGGALHAIRESVDVALFLTGMMLLAELAREEGVFDWVADIAVHHARGSASRLFLWVYLAGIVVTAVLSNDATAVVLTPAVLAAVRRAKVEPRPHLLACALIANAASFLLPIANPANLVVYGAQMPSLGAWMRIFLLPSVAAVAATFVCLRMLARKALAGEAAAVGEPYRMETAGWLALAGIGVAAAGLLVSSALGIPLGAPTLGAGVAVMVVVAIRDRGAPLRAVRNVAWSVLPLVTGLFMIVEALNRAGMMRLTKAGLTWLAAAPDGVGKFCGGFGIALLSNGMNNLPAGLAAGTALRQMGQHGLLAHAVMIGVDLGPNLSVTGSLATILWLIALRRENAEITGWEFLKIGVVAMPVALGLALLALL
jgi:arsenical pump membrane protein